MKPIIEQEICKYSESFITRLGKVLPKGEYEITIKEYVVKPLVYPPGACLHKLTYKVNSQTLTIETSTLTKHKKLIEGSFTYDNFIKREVIKLVQDPLVQESIKESISNE